MKEQLSFAAPVDGDMLNQYDGVQTRDDLEITVRLSAAPGARITVNNQAAVYDGTHYTAAVRLNAWQNTLTARRDDGLTQSIVVYWLKDAVQKFRLSLDDNIHCLRDLARNADRYHSIFDNDYLRLYRDAHERYGTKVHMNIFFQEMAGFDLTMMPLKYRSEFQEQASWLRLAPHARQEFPDCPYIQASYETVRHDFTQIAEQLYRFAGYETLSPVTTVHWGEAGLEAIRALRDGGLRCLMGYFEQTNGRFVASYYLNDEQKTHLSGRDFWTDHATGMMFGRINRVLNIGPLANIIPELERERLNPHKTGFMEVMIHEQYFYPDYSNYLPDFRERILSTLEWITSQGYRPAWVSDVIGQA